MKNLINLIKEHKFVEAEDEINSIIPLIMEKKIFEMKKAVAAKMCEQMPIVGPTTAQKRMTDVIEMDVSKEKPEIDDIEDIRKEKAVNSSMKTNLGGDQEVASGKTDLPKKQTVNASGKEDLKEEEEQLDEARINIVKARVRGGKIQRRKKVSNVPGMTLRGGTLTRMSAAERRRRKMGARRGKIKRKAKLSRSLMKRKRSLQKRKSLGL
jgi:hypothetical protein